MGVDNRDIFSENYDALNTQENKRISLVVTIEDVPFLLSNRDVFTRVKYGDSGLEYGLPGLVYGGKKRVENVKNILSLKGSSLSILQKIEPEQAKGNTSILRLAFIDEKQIMTQLISQGVIIDDIIGKSVTVDLGYEEISYPQDYFVIFRGTITDYTMQSGLCILEFSDANVKRRKKIFYQSKTILTSGITDVETTIPVVSTGDFHKAIFGPDLTLDPAIKTYIKINDEFIEYVGISSPTSFSLSVSRGARGTTAAAHDINDTVFAFMEIEDNALDMALKLMLSGFGGNWKTGEPLRHIGQSLNKISFPIGVDVKRKYGLSDGDFITISGAAVGGNNATFVIQDIQSPNDIDKNNEIIVDGPVFTELMTSAVVDFRSQFDVYPTSAGMRLTPNEVDVEGHLNIRNQFLGGSENGLRFLLGASETSGKNFIESEVYLPVSSYAITRFGRMSVRVTKPPIADQLLQILTKDNVVDPARITLHRASNKRKFFNEIAFFYDFDDDGEFLSSFRLIDSESLSLLGLSTDLTIKSKGMRTDILGPGITSLERRSNLFLSRYRRGALTIKISCFWGTGNKIEAGDVIAIDGEGLEISNPDTGDRNFGVQLFEVVNRALSIKTGKVSLTVINGINASASDRFATLSPSSLVGSGASTTLIPIKDSFSEDDPIFPGIEGRKWEDYIGLPIRIHSKDYDTFDETKTFNGFTDENKDVMILSTALSAPPPEDFVVDIAVYPDDLDPTVNSLYKAVHAFTSPTVLISSGIDDLSFNVGGGDIGKFFVGGIVRVHTLSFSLDSREKRISEIDGVKITVSESLGFASSGGQSIDVIGFPDKGAAYKII